MMLFQQYFNLTFDDVGGMVTILDFVKLKVDVTSLILWRANLISDKMLRL